MQTPEDIGLAVEAGADAVGVILAPSPRRVERDELRRLALAIPPFVDRVGVVVDDGDGDVAALHDLGFTLQFSGDETGEFCERLAGGRPYVKAVHVAAETTEPAHAPGAFDEYPNATLMFDTRIDGRFGGTGVPFAWTLVTGVARRRRVIVSGGLTPGNVAACVRAVRPYAVDVRSGVETAERKDLHKMRAFVRAVKEADAEA